MIFFPLVILGVVLYITGKRVSSVMIFFFFLFEGFQIVPLSLFETSFGVSKPEDFCVLYVILLVAFGLFQYRCFLPKPNTLLLKSFYIWLLCIVTSIVYNYYVLHVSITDIVRTTRFYSILLAYFLFIRLTKKEAVQILRLLFFVTFFQSILFILQVIIGKAILTGTAGGWMMEDLGFRRFYNLPYFIYYFVFYALFRNPFQGTMRYCSIGVVALAMILPMHRGLIVAFGLSVFLGIYIQSGGLRGFLKYAFIIFILLTPFMGTIMSRFENKTDSDINSVMMGAYKEYAEEYSNMDVDGTFLFRIALFYERFHYILHHPKNYPFGLGYMTEGSSQAEDFEFVIGLMDEDTYEITQLDTSDIAWVNIFTRFGFVGTIFYLCFFTLLMYFFWKRRKTNSGLVPFLFLLLFILISLTSSHLYYMWMFTIVFLDIAIIKEDELEDELKVEGYFHTSDLLEEESMDNG